MIISNKCLSSYLFKEKLPKILQDCGFTFSLITRFLYSCLTDADSFATESFMDPKALRRASYQPSKTLKSIVNLLDQKLKAFPTPNPEDTVNQQRAKVLQTAQRKPLILLEFSPSLFQRGGKTLSSFKFALEHALKHNKERILYVIPFTSIIEQNAQVLREIVAPLETETFTPIIEHHSALDPEKERLDTKLATENWDAPIIITTVGSILRIPFGS